MTMQGVEMEGGSLTFAGVVSLMESSLVGSELSGSLGSALSLSGGTVTGSTVFVSSGQMTVDGRCVLTDSPVSVGGAGSSVTISGAELRSDGLSAPVTVQSGGAATVTQTVFRSTAGDIAAVSVSDAGSLTVGESQLVGADGSSNPFPCDGTVPDCAGEHAEQVVVDGPAAITLASPLVCDTVTGECRSGNAQCFAAYSTLNDAYRTISNADPRVASPGSGARGGCDSATGTGVGGGGWYRFSGAVGDTLPLSPPGWLHCGTDATGWLSGWDGGVGTGCSSSYFGGMCTDVCTNATGPPCGYQTPGRYPAATEGVVEMTACFDDSGGDPCYMCVVVGVVRCDEFLLWRLPYVPNCNAGYCTAPSGLFGGSGR